LIFGVTVQLSDLNDYQLAHLNEMTTELMIMGAFWALDAGNREKFLNRARQPDASRISVAEILREILDDFPSSTIRIKPSTFNDFLRTLEQPITPVLDPGGDPDGFPRRVEKSTDVRTQVEPITHSWIMISQFGGLCRWKCETHDPPCHKTTFDGKASK
jgi:hypothetical protein